MKDLKEGDAFKIRQKIVLLTWILWKIRVYYRSIPNSVVILLCFQHFMSVSMPTKDDLIYIFCPKNFLSICCFSSFVLQHCHYYLQFICIVCSFVTFIVSNRYSNYFCPSLNRPSNLIWKVLLGPIPYLFQGRLIGVYIDWSPLSLDFNESKIVKESIISNT